MKARQSFRRGVVLLLMLALVFGTFGLAGWGAGEAYAVTDPVEAAVSTTLNGYYGESEKYVIDDWEELAAIKASGGNLEEFILPQTPASGSPAVIVSLIKGDMELAGVAVANMVSEGELNKSYSAYGCAFNIIAMEAYNRSVSVQDQITYNKVAAIDELLAYRGRVEGVDNQFYGLDYYTGQPYSDIDGAAMALIALSIFEGDSVVDSAMATAVDQVKKAQTDNGDFGGSWGPGANTTAVVIQGLIAAGENLNACYTSEDAIKTPVDGLLNYFVADGGYWYGANSAIADAVATKQAALAMADIRNGESFYTTFTASDTNYISANAQVVNAAGEYFEAEITLGQDKTIGHAISRAIDSSETVSYSDYNIFINKVLCSEPSAATITNGDQLLAVSNIYTKIAYFVVNDSDQMGISSTNVAFGGTEELTLVEEELQTGDVNVLPGKAIEYGNTIASNSGYTDSSGKISITPVEAMQYEIAAKRVAWDFSSGTMLANIDYQTAILPAKITMTAGSPQTATVSVRIEGPDSNVLNTTLTTARTDGSRLTVYDAVTQALTNADVPYEAYNKYISSIDGIESGLLGGSSNWDGWAYTIVEPKYLEGTEPLSGMGTQFISGGEEIIVYYGNDSFTTAYPILSSKLNADGTVTVSIKNYETDWSTGQTSLVPTAGVSIYWGYNSGGTMTYTATTGADGIATIPSIYATIGQHPVQVRKTTEGLPDIIRLSPSYAIGVSSSDTSNGENGIPVKEMAYITVKGPYGTLKSKTSYAWYDDMTALSILQASGLTLQLSGGGYVNSIDGVGEFDLGENSGWLYKVNGTTPTMTAPNQYTLSPDDNVIWYYSLDYTTDSSSSAWTTENAATAAVTEIKAKESSGTAIVSITKSELGSMADAGSAIKITSSLATIEMDPKTLLGLSKTAGSGLEITASKVDLDSLAGISDSVKDKIGDRPVIDLSVTSAGKTISQFAGEVTVRVPYTLAAGENPNAIIIYLLNDKGELEIIKGSSYDAETKTVEFVTDHFSTYAVGHNYKGFTDIEGNWAADYINYLAAREIVSGMTDTTFAPGANVTRAQFVQLLANMAEADITSSGALSTPAFKDVNSKAWYASAVTWAAQQGVVLGTKNNDGTWSFDPNGYVTRQDMAVMLMRYMSEVEGVEITGKNIAIKFNDQAHIASYAKEAVDKMSAAGVINGKTSTTFAPSDKATRSESAKMIYALYSEYI